MPSLASLKMAQMQVQAAVVAEVGHRGLPFTTCVVTFLGLASKA